MTFTINDPRGQLVLLEAITFAIEGMSRLPEEHRPERDIEDMKSLLNEAAPPNLALFQSEARRQVDVLLGIMPRENGGWVLVHNHVRHGQATVSGTRGFRAWYEPPAAYHVVCACGWMPESGPHYRIERS
jgi:hypothetical protein